MIAVVIGALIVTAMCASVVTRAWPRAAGGVLAIVPAVAFAYFGSLIPQIGAGGVVAVALPWLPDAGVTLSLSLDGLSLVFALLITGLGALVVVYAGAYLEADPARGRFMTALLAFMAAMLGVVLADDVIALFMFWELTGVCSFLLVGHGHDREAARRAARQALVVTGVGGLALLAGLLLLSTAAGGTYSLSTIIERGDQVRAHPLYAPAFALIALGAFTKSAQFPFHFWLPSAMAAPTPASAYLHSATMVKAGIYLLARLDRALGGTPLWTWTLVGVGSVTMLVGAVQALRHVDMKRVLAYSTITALGTLTVLLGLSFGASIKAAIVFLVVHALYKGALFMIAGIVDKTAGTRDVTRLAGLARAAPWVGAAAVVAGLSMAGLPPLFGFVGKELAYKAKLGFDAGGWLLPVIAVLANALTAAAAAILVVRPFFGRSAGPRRALRPGRALTLGPLVLAAGCVALGLIPSLAGPIVGAAVTAVALEPVPIHLSLWYGAGPALLLSGLTFGVGVGVYLAWTRWRGAATAAGVVGRGERVFEAVVVWVARAGARVAGVFEGMTAAAIAGWTFAVLAVGIGVSTVPQLRAPEALGATWPSDVALAALACIAAIAAAAARSRTGLVIAVGAVGLLVSVWFATLGAVDLAITQLLVETVVVIVALGALRGASDRIPVAMPRVRARRFAVAVAAGAAVTTVLLAVLAAPMESPPADYFVAASVPEAHGRNVVNTILVDFRALDTLGEIAVLALGLLVVGSVWRARAFRVSPPSVIARGAARLLAPVLLGFAAFMLLRGHNAPGGGFIAGLIVVGAVVVRNIAAGGSSRDVRLPVAPGVVAAVGVAVALASSLAAAAVGGAYFEGLWCEVAGVALGTPLVFDVGVCMVVVGFGVGVLSRATAPIVEESTCS